MRRLRRQRKLGEFRRWVAIRSLYRASKIETETAYQKDDALRAIELALLTGTPRCKIEKMIADRNREKNVREIARLGRAW